MGVNWLSSERPNTKFAPNLQAPFYIAADGNDELIGELVTEILELEEQITNETLVSEVPRSVLDPYPYTQHWKQHSIFWDKSVLDGEHLVRFAMTSTMEKLFHIIRKQYLIFLKEMNYPRVKIYIHGWANVLRNSQWISQHYHQNSADAYLSGTYYLTTVDTHLKLINPLKLDFADMIPTKKGTIVMFPSYVPHESSVYNGTALRISIAFDLVTSAFAKTNPWRPYCLFDDPATMDGLDMYLTNRSLTN